MADIKQFPKAERKRTVAEALAVADAEGFERVVIIGVSEPKQAVMLIASEMTAAEALWFIERGRKLLLGDE